VLESIEPSMLGDVDEASEIDGRVVIEEGATVVGSSIRGPAIIGPKSEIVDSYVGPFTSIAAGVQVRNSEVENSVILDGVKLTNVPRLVDSLIGRGSEVARSGRPPRATRLLLGDDCSVDIQ
jgi:glucose-1-phosphate thymidylyltransferase